MEGTMICDTVWDEPPETVVFKGRHDWPYYVPEKTATHMIVNNGLTGHSACTGCGKAIDPWDCYCKHCGALLKGGWK